MLVVLVWCLVWEERMESTHPVGLQSKGCKRKGFWGVLCVLPYSVRWEPVETAGSRGQSRGLSQAPSIFLPETFTLLPPALHGVLREQPRRSHPRAESPPPQLPCSPLRVVCGVQGHLVAEVHVCVCLPHSWPWTTESSSWRPVQRPTSMWRT